MKIYSKSNPTQALTNEEILYEVNRDRSEEWQDYDLADLENNPKEILEWIDPQYFNIYKD